jgi:hypothetical protein
MQSRRRCGSDLCSDAVAVGAGANRFYSQRVILVRVVITQKPRRAVVGHDNKIEIAIVINVAVSSASADNRLLQSRPQLGRDLFEFVVP